MAEKIQAGQYRYRSRRTGHSSTRFGHCEICKAHVPDVYYQVEERYVAFRDKRGILTAQFWTSHNCNSYFGHEQCLVNVRRGLMLQQVVDDEDHLSYALHAGDVSLVEAA